MSYRNQPRLQPQLCVCVPTKPATANAGPPPALGAPVICLDVLQPLHLQSHQWYKSAKITQSQGTGSDFSPNFMYEKPAGACVLPQLLEAIRMIEIECATNVKCLNHPETIPRPGPWRNCLHETTPLCWKDWGPLAVKWFPFKLGHQSLLDQECGPIQLGCCMETGFDVTSLFGRI